MKVKQLNFYPHALDKYVASSLIGYFIIQKDGAYFNCYLEQEILSFPENSISSEDSLEKAKSYCYEYFSSRILKWIEQTG